MDDRRHRFETLCLEAEPRLRRAFAGWCGTDLAADATAEALAWAWEHEDRLADLENPVGYLYRVGQSKVRSRRAGLEDRRVPPEVSSVEPALIPAVRALPEQQRTAVWLSVACGFTHAETAEAMGISRTAVGTHVTRAMTRLRSELGVPAEGSYER